MLTKEKFIQFMEAVEAYDKEVTRWDDFGIEIFQLPICELAWNIIDCFVESHFNEDGQDWISWYLFERVSIINGEILPCYDENDQEFYVNTSEDLWELVKDKLIDCVNNELKNNIS